MIGKYGNSTVTGFKYATVDNGVATTVAALAKDTTYLLEGNVAASETPVFTLEAAGDYIEFDKALGYTFAGTVAGANTTNETGTVIRFSITAGYPTYLESADATIKAKYDVWKTNYVADVNSEYEAAFLLNADPLTLPVGSAYLKIASITQVAGGWELEITSDAATLTAETNNSGFVGNGYLAIKYASDLAGLTSGGTLVNLPVTVTNGKITVTVTAAGAKFMKATLSTTPVVQN